MDGYDRWYEMRCDARLDRDPVLCFVERHDADKFIVWTEAGQETICPSLSDVADWAMANAGTVPIAEIGVAQEDVDAAWEKAAGGER